MSPAAARNSSILYLLQILNLMPLDTLTRFCLGLGLASMAARLLLNWATDRFFEFSDAAAGQAPGVVGPANMLITVVALAGLAGAVVAFRRGVRGHALSAAVAFNGVALLANPMIF